MLNRVLSIFAFSILIFLSSGCATNSSLKSASTNKSNSVGNKVIIYDIKRKGCPACVYQERVFKVKEVKELLDRDCEVIYVDINEQDNLPKEWMRTNATPTVHFVDANNKKLIPSIHSVQPYQFRDAILAAKKELDSRKN